MLTIIWTIKLIIIVIGIGMIWMGYIMINKEIKSEKYEIEMNIKELIKTSLKGGSPGILFSFLGVILIIVPLVVSVPFHYKETKAEEEKSNAIPKEKPIEFPKKEEILKKMENKAKSNK